MQAMAPAAAPPAAPLLLPRSRAAYPGATARARAAASLVAVVRAQPDTTSAAASSSTSEPPPPLPEFKPPPGFKTPEPKRFAVKDGQQGSVLGASLAIPLRLGTGVFVLGYSPSLVSPSAPPAPSAPPPSSSSAYGYGQGGYPPAYPPRPAGGYGFGFGYGAVPVAFPPGTHPDVERAFRAADRDGSGAIDEHELQGALSSAYHRFSIRTVRLLMFLFNDPSSPSRMGPAQFVSLWNCLGQWRGIFDRYDRDWSGKIDSRELTEALRSIGYAVPPSVIELLIANYNNGVPSNGALDFDNFVECGMIVKGLTEKFKEKDTRYTGSATLTYDGFLSMVIPFIVP